MMRKGPSPALVTTALGSGALAVGFGTSAGLSAIASAGLTAVSTLIATGTAAAGSLMGAIAVPSTVIATPFFTMFLDLFGGASRGFWDATTGGDLYSEVLGGIAGNIGLGGGTAAAAAPTAAPCPFC